MPQSLPNGSHVPPDRRSASRSGKRASKSAGDRIGPTPERLAKATSVGRDAVADVVTDVTDKRGNSERVATVRLYDGDVLELLLKRKVIEFEQHACGGEFYRHWEKSGLAANGVMDPARERVDGGNYKPESETRQWHLERWSLLVRKLGQVHSEVLCACVLLGEPVQQFGLRKGKRKDAKRAGEWAQARLTAALEQLTIIMLGEKQTRRGSSMMAGARPVIMPREDEA